MTKTATKKVKATKPATYTIFLSVEVEVTINDPEVIDRCVENKDGWQQRLYPLMTADDVLEHLASNCVRNGCDNLRSLDGWADLNNNSATMRIVGCDKED